jgi:DNA-binding LacI/PurR family transcriptional regulator
MTTVDQQGYKMGRKVAKILLKIINNIFSLMSPSAKLLLLANYIPGKINKRFYVSYL